MSNLIRYTMTNVPSGLDKMYTRVTDVTNNVIFEGVKNINGNAVEIDIGTAGNIGEGFIVFADNFEGNIPSFRGYIGYGIISSGEEGFLDLSGKIYNTAVINRDSEIWSTI